MLRQLGRLIVIFAAIAPLGINGAPASAQDESASTAHTYPEEVTQTYLSHCVSSGKGYGMTDTQATSYCNCTINKFQDNYTLEEFVSISQQISQNQTPPQLMEIVNACTAAVTSTSQ
jgi:hypothetical protein